MPSRKITQTITGQVTIFREADVASTRDDSTFPVLNLNQSIKQGEGYAPVQNVELFPFSKRNVEFADAINIDAGNNTRMVGTVTLGLVKVTENKGRHYTKWEVISHELTPSDQVPYASKDGEAAADDSAPLVQTTITEAEAPF